MTRALTLAALLLACAVCLTGGAAGEDNAPSVQPATVLPKLLDLGSTRCIPCKKMAPILEEVKKEFAGKAEVEFIDVWDNRAAGEQYGVLAIPTQIFFDAAGKEVFRHTGFYGKEDILAQFEKMGVK